MPDEVAVIGVDNDEYVCRFASPPLTSIDVNPEEIGYQAAALVRADDGGREAAGRLCLEIPPRGMVARRSTEAWALEDEAIAAAVVRHSRPRLRGHCRGKPAGACHLSRSTLERRFKQVLGRTPKEEIVRQQVEHAERALARTDLPVAKVAAKAVSTP